MTVTWNQLLSILFYWSMRLSVVWNDWHIEENIMKILKRLTSPLFLLLLALSVFTAGCGSVNEETVPGITTMNVDGSTSVDDVVLSAVLDTLPLDTLSTAETDGLLFMREEEKLARDVYIYLFAEWGSKVFYNISESEQTHTDAILTLLDRYNLSDPVGDNAEGVFEDDYLQGLYDALILQGSSSLVNALYVGAEIEEIDLIDIQTQIDVLEGNEDIAIVYENLMKGSRNHLRAFVKNLANQGIDYAPQHLSQEEYDAIINEDFETN